MPPKKLPRSLDELYQAGGPQRYIDAAEKQAGDEEARWWLPLLEGLGPLSAPEWRTLTDPDGFADSAAAKLVVKFWIEKLRRRLRRKTPPDIVRAQTRERVRGHRARKAGHATD
jgi:hypothetical protein